MCLCGGDAGAGGYLTYTTADKTHRKKFRLLQRHMLHQLPFDGSCLILYPAPFEMKPLIGKVKQNISEGALLP